MSANDGGDPIRLSRQPVERPVIERDDHLYVPQVDDDGLMVWSPCSFTFVKDGWRITYHRAIVAGQASDDLGNHYWILQWTHETVVTWERVSSAASQI